MLDFGTAQQDQRSPFTGRVARVEPPSIGEAFAGAMEANDRVDGFAAQFRNQSDYLQSRTDAFTAKTGVALPRIQFRDGASAADLDQAWNDHLGNIRTIMDAEAKKRNDPTLAPPSDSDIVLGGINFARGAQAKQAELSESPLSAGRLLGNLGASGVGMAKDPYNLISLTALGIAPEGAPLLAAALRTGAVMGGQQLMSDIGRYGYRQAVDPSYGRGAVVSDVLEAGAAGALFGVGEGLGGSGVRKTLGAAAGGALGGAALGGIADGPQGALEGAVGGAALPLLGAGAQSLRVLGMSWRALKARSPDVAMSMPLEVRDAGEVAEKAGDLEAQKPNWPGPRGDAAHSDALGAAEDALVNGKPFELPLSTAAEATARRGQVFFPGGAVDVRYGLAEHSDLVTSHDADFNLRADYPPELQPRDRSSAPAQDQVNTIAANLEPERLGPSPEANSGAPIVGPDGVVESGNGRTIGIGQAYDAGRGEGYRAWLQRQGYDTTGFDKPVLVGMRETAMDPAARADFAHAANGSASLRMSATEQALSDARHLEPGIVDLAKTPDLSAAANRDFARAFVAKLPQGERGGMLTREGGLSANGVRRAQAAMAARAYGDQNVLARGFDHPDPNIKAIAGALTDAAAPWARMRDAVTRGDIEPGHDITRDMLQAAHAIMRARDEGRPAWEMLNQGDIFQSDTTQLVARMFFRDEAMRQPAGRARVAEALRAYADEAGKNTIGDRLFDDALSPRDILRDGLQKLMPSAPERFVLASLRKAEGDDWLAGMFNKLIDEAEAAPEKPPIAMERSLAHQLKDLIREADNREPAPAAAKQEVEHTTYKAGDVSYSDEAPANAIDTSDLDYGGEHQIEIDGQTYYYDLDFVPDEHDVEYSSAGVQLHAVVSMLSHENEAGEMVASADHLTAVQFYKLKKAVLDDLRNDGSLAEQAEQLTEIDRYNRLTPEQQRAEDEALAEANARARADADRQKDIDIRAAVDKALADGWRPEANRFGDLYNWHTAPEGVKQFASPQSIEKVNTLLRARGFAPTRADLAPNLRRSPERLAAELDQAGQDALAAGRASEDAAARARPETTAEPGAETQPDLTLRNPKTGAEAQAQEVASLRDMFKRLDIAGDPNADILTRASSMVIGDRLSKLIGDTKVFVVGPAEMRTLAEGRMKIRAGMEPAGFWDRDNVVLLDDVMRNRGEAAYTLLHEGVHGGIGPLIDKSDSTFRIFDQLREMAVAAHVERGGSIMDHYGLTAFRDGTLSHQDRLAATHEFAAEGNSNGEFQRLLASVPISAEMAKAFGLTREVGNTLWDAFVGAVRKILGMKPEDHSLLDAVMRVSHLALEKREGEMIRGIGDDLAPMMRPIEASTREATAEERATAAKAFSDVKDAIAYRIATDRIQQHADGPRAGFLSVITRDPNERGGVNVESLGAYYQDKMAAMVGQMTEAYGSKMAGLKQDAAGFRDVISELFNADSKNETAKAVADAMRKADVWATEEAKRLGKVFTAAEDWRMVQWWESSRAIKFGQAEMRADMEREITAGGLKVFDPDTHEEANPLRMRAILDGAVDRITSDASLGGGPATGGGAFKTDMRVFRFNDGEAGRDAYLRLMDKYGVGAGNYLPAMQAHYARIGRELGMMEVLGPGWMEVGEKLRQESLVAARRIEANEAKRTTGEKVRALPKDAIKFAFSWLDSENRVNATWEHMSGQSSGVGSELMAGVMAGARGYEVSTKMGSAIVTAVPADSINAMMAAHYLGMDMGRVLKSTMEAFLKDSPHLREEAERLGIAAHASIDAALGTKRFGDQVLGEKLMARMADFVIRAQGLHAWDNALRRVFVQEFLGTIGQRAGVAFGNLDPRFARFIKGYGFDAADWAEMSRPEHMLQVDQAKYLHLDNLPQPLRVRLASAIYDQRQFAYQAGGTERVRSIGANAKAGTFAGELGKAAMMFKGFAMTLQATWGKRAVNEAGQGRYGTLMALGLGMTMAGALATQARALLQGKDPRNTKDPWFWAEAGLQGGALGYWGDFLHNAFSRSDTSLTESALRRPRRSMSGWAARTSKNFVSAAS